MNEQAHKVSDHVSKVISTWSYLIFGDMLSFLWTSKQ